MRFPTVDNSRMCAEPQIRVAVETDHEKFVKRKLAEGASQLHFCRYGAPLQRCHIEQRSKTERLILAEDLTGLCLQGGIEQNSTRRLHTRGRILADERA